MREIECDGSNICLLHENIPFYVLDRLILRATNVVHLIICIKALIIFSCLSLSSDGQGVSSNPNIQQKQNREHALQYRRQIAERPRNAFKTAFPVVTQRNKKENNKRNETKNET